MPLLYKNKHAFFSFSLFLAFACGTLGPITGQALALEDAIIAVVNDEVITFQDLRDYLDSVYIRMKLENRPADEIQAAMDDLQASGITKLIRDRLILNEAEKKGVEVKAEAVDEQLDKIKSQYPTPQAFMDSLTSDGYTLTDLRNKIRDQLNTQYVVETEVRAKIHVNPQEITDYYNNNLVKFEKPERVNLDSIYIAGTQVKEEDQRKIQQVLDALKSGKDFRQVAQEYSEMPAIGIIAKGELQPQIEQTVFQLAVDEVSSVVELEKGYYIFKLIGKIPRQVEPLDTVKNEIHSRLFQEKFQKKLSEWINKLEKQAYIEIKK